MTAYAATGRPDQRNCSLYRIYVLDPRTNYTTITLGYIGETARLPFVRFMEHLYEQPFSDTIVGPPHIDPRVFVGKDAVLAAEQAAVEAERPLYNYEWNLDNPDRIPIPEARRQRVMRDAARQARGEAVVPPPQPDGRAGQTSRRPPAPAVAPSGEAWLSPAWRRRRNSLLARSAVWLTATLALWAATVHYLPLPAGSTVVPAGLLTAAVLTVTAPNWRRRRGLRRDTCRFAAAVLAVAALATLALLLARPVHNPTTRIPTVVSTRK